MNAYTKSPNVSHLCAINELHLDFSSAFCAFSCKWWSFLYSIRIKIGWMSSTLSERDTIINVKMEITFESQVL